MENYQTLPQPSFWEATKKGFANILSFRGRSRRSEFWWFALSFWVCSFLLSLTYQPFVSTEVTSIVSNSISFLIIPIMVRRMHDRGLWGILPFLAWIFSAAIDFYLLFAGYIDKLTSVNVSPKVVEEMISDPVVILLYLGSFVVSITLLVFLCLDGKKEPNRFGPSPKYVAEFIVNQ